MAAPVRDGPEQRPLGVAAQAEPVEIGGQVLFKIMVVSFLPKLEPKATKPAAAANTPLQLY